MVQIFSNQFDFYFPLSIIIEIKIKFWFYDTRMKTVPYMYV